MGARSDDSRRRVVPDLGARRAEEPDDSRGFRVYLDPAGHPFCLVFGGPGVADRPQFR